MSPRAIGEDDFDSYDRPRRHTRPRTKDRPSYPDAVPGFVITVDRGRFTVRVGAGAHSRNVYAVKARPLGRKGVVVGDRVRLVGDDSGDEGALARIIEVLDRTTVLRRSSDDSDPVERILVANATQLVIVASIADPPPRPRLIDRCLVAAYAAGMRPLLCLTKGDLASPAELTGQYEPLGVAVETTSPGADLDQLRARLDGHRSVFVGHSGVGKSTLVNALIPGAHRAIGEVNEVTGRGRHTSTSAIALQLPFAHESWVIDTPGVRSFGLSHVSRERILSAFPDLEALAEGCPRGCSHEGDAPECALDAAAARGDLASARLESFRRMLGSGQ